MKNKLIFSPKDIFVYSFNKAKQYFKQFLVVLFGLFVLSIVQPEKPDTATNFILFLVSMTGSIYITMSVYAVILRIIKDETVILKDFFTWPKNGLKSFLASIVASLIFVPMILLGIVLSALFMGQEVIIVSILAVLLLLTLYLNFRVMFARYFALEYGTGPIESIKKSFCVTKDKVSSIIVILLCMVGVVIIGAVALLVGLLWAIPTILIAQIVLYKLISENVLTVSALNSHKNLPEVQPLELEANSPVDGAQN